MVEVGYVWRSVPGWSGELNEFAEGSVVYGGTETGYDVVEDGVGVSEGG